MEPNGIQEGIGGNGRKGEECLERDKNNSNQMQLKKKKILVVERIKSENGGNLEGSKMKSVYPRMIGILILKI